MAYFLRTALTVAAFGTVGFLAGCGDDSTASQQRVVTDAATSDITLAAHRTGPTPFVAFVDLTGASTTKLTEVTYEIQPMSGTASRPVHVSYSIDSLRARGRVSGPTVALPVFGLYAGYSNTVAITLRFGDGTSQALSSTIATPAYSSPLPFNSPTITQARASGSALGFDFFAVKPNSVTPAALTVFDTDGHIRWVSALGAGNGALFRNNGFDVGVSSGPVVRREELDGIVTPMTPDPTVTQYHHDFALGPQGTLMMPNYPDRADDTLVEMTPAGQIVKTWDMEKIIGDYMTAMGDNPATFVRKGFDWFHMNSVIFDPRDRSLLLSSRENFVIKIGYDAGDVRWVLGDTTKFWGTFPSLRAKALAISGDSLVPIGQHSLSLTLNGDLLMFNNGAPSRVNPAGTSAGVSREYSAVSSYKIDSSAFTATPGSTIDDGRAIFSPYCSSTYLSPDGSNLITYSQAENSTVLRLKGLGPQNQLVFDLSFPTSIGCTSGWNAVIVPFESLTFTA